MSTLWSEHWSSRLGRWQPRRSQTPFVFDGQLVGYLYYTGYPPDELFYDPQTMRIGLRAKGDYVSNYFSPIYRSI